MTYSWSDNKGVKARAGSGLFASVPLSLRKYGAMASLCLFLLGCAQADVPGARNVNIPSPTTADERPEAIGEQPDSVLYLPLGRDVLMPTVSTSDSLPSEFVGPFELRSETLAGALQLILAEYEVSLAFESDEGLNRRITVANLQGPLNKVVDRICGLADLYCAYEDGLVIVKDTQTFTVKIPPISQDTSFMQNVSSGLAAIIGTQPIIDQSTRTIIYEATQRTSEYALRYFQRMRSNTALIVFETYIWEVKLNAGNSAGINWSAIESIGKFTSNISLSGSVGSNFTNPVSIGLPTTGFENGGNFSPTNVFNFLSTFGAVKTISQPKITVLSGSEARLRVADTENFVSEISQTIDDGQVSTSVNTNSVETGFELTIASSWDNATIYASIDINLTNVNQIDDFPFSSQGEGDNRTTTTIQLPSTSERELETQVRIRPGDSLLIAGLVREGDNQNTAGPGFMRPIIKSSSTSEVENLELVFLMRPRVIAYTSQTEEEQFSTVRGAKAEIRALQNDIRSLQRDKVALEDEGQPFLGLKRDVAAPVERKAPVDAIPQGDVLLPPMSMPAPARAPINEDVVPVVAVQPAPSVALRTESRTPSALERRVLRDPNSLILPTGFVSRASDVDRPIKRLWKRNNLHPMAIKNSSNHVNLNSMSGFVGDLPLKPNDPAVSGRYPIRPSANQSFDSVTPIDLDPRS
jgi:hypothetical protein